MSARWWTKGFTLIELMIVVAIVAILVSIAVPMMKLHYEKAKLTEVTSSMSAAAAAVTAYYQDNYLFPQTAQTSIAMLASTMGVSIPPATASRISSVNIAANTGTISFVIQNISSGVDGSSLILSPSTTNEGAVIWSWGASAGFPTSLVPSK